MVFVLGLSASRGSAAFVTGGTKKDSKHLMHRYVGQSLHSSLPPGVLKDSTALPCRFENDQMIVVLEVNEDSVRVSSP